MRSSIARLSLLGGVVALAATACHPGPDSRVSGGAPSYSIQASVVDTLTTGDDPLLADPIALYVDSRDRYLAVDRSDKNLKVYDVTGAYQLTVGRPGPGPGEFGALWGGGELGDTLFGYDFAKTVVSFFSPAGRYVRSIRVHRPGEPMPASVQSVDDSLLLVVGFPLGARNRGLLALVGRDGSVRSRFFDLREYFTPENPPLLENSYVVADAGHGIVVAGLRGGAGLSVFDYQGRRLASAPILLDGRTPLPTYRALIEGNRGNVRRPDNTYVIDNVNALVALTVLDGSHALLQVMNTRVGAQPWVDLTEGGRFLVATFDRERGTVSTSADTSIVGGLLGRDSRGNALTYRYLGEPYNQIEISRLSLRPSDENQRRPR